MSRIHVHVDRSAREQHARAARSVDIRLNATKKEKWHARKVSLDTATCAACHLCMKTCKVKGKPAPPPALTVKQIRPEELSCVKSM